ncbi:UNVERIFIED_CONTAM: hypothetical protein NY603_26670, partial [Bacteroidetes bacterium 56_B9]
WAQKILSIFNIDLHPAVPVCHHHHLLIKKTEEMARSSQTSYRTNSSVKPTEREVRAYRVEQADRILLERVANVRSTLMQPRVGKRSSAGP